MPKILRYYKDGPYGMPVLHYTTDGKNWANSAVTSLNAIRDFRKQGYIFEHEQPN